MKCQITCHGRVETVEVTSEESLLEAAIKVGLNPPYSCLEGICGTCEAQVVKGEVLCGDEIIAGSSSAIVKTCMTRPRSAVIITYDKSEPVL